MPLSPLLVMLAWPLIALGLFSVLPPRRAVIVNFILAWLFLPVASFPIPYLPDYNKITATCLGTVLGILLFDFSRLKSFRFSLMDLPMLIFCVSPLPAAIVNSFGLYEGLSGVTQRLIAWGIPYLVGRLYFSDLTAHRDLALGIVMGGLIYIPFCLFEIFFGPYWRAWVYGFYQVDPGQVVRFGGWRPVVFMESGLMVALWMTVASVTALWLWLTGVLRLNKAPAGGSPPAEHGGSGYPPRAMLISVGLVLLVLTTLLLKSVNGWVLLGLGMAVLVGATRWRRAWPVYALVAASLVYVIARASGVWAGVEIVDAVQTLIDARRSQSLLFRIENEIYILEKVQENLMLGLGRRSLDFYRPDPLWVLVFDSLWIIVFAETGWLGLIGLLATLVTPILLFTWRYPAYTWRSPAVAPAAALAVCVCLYIVDNLLNAMVNPIFMLIAGGLVRLPAKETT